MSGLFRKRNKRRHGRASVAAGATVSPGRWGRSAPQVWQVAEERADAVFRSRQLDEEIDQTLDSNESLTAEVRAEREKVELLEQLLDERAHLLSELHRLAVREREATALVGRAERALAAERATPPARPDDGVRQRPGRMVRVLADDGAWQAVCIATERRRERRGMYLAQLIEAEVGEDTDRSVRPSQRRRRGPGEGVSVPVVHALRVFVTEDTWALFRVAATELELGLGAYVGELVEADARRVGWRATPPAVSTGEEF